MKLMESNTPTKKKYVKKKLRKESELLKKQWLKRAERDANLAQEARRASINFTKAALSQSNDDHIYFKASASDKLKDN